MTDRGAVSPKHAVCARCDTALRPIEIKGYRMLIEDDRWAARRRIVTEACPACGLVHFRDPNPARLLEDD